MDIAFSINKQKKTSAPIATKRPSVYVHQQLETKRLIEEAVGAVEQKEVNFPKGLGEAHPFDARFTEGVYKKVPIVFGAVNKYVDYIVGPGITVKSDNEEAKKFLTNWIRDTQFNLTLRRWVKEALIKPGGYIELTEEAMLDEKGNSKKILKPGKILDAKYMFIKRDKKGKILKYNQYVGAFDKFSKEKIIPLDVTDIAALHYNVVGSDAYGLGIVNPLISSVDHLLGAEKHMHEILKRKASCPIHVKLGTVAADGTIVNDASQDQINEMGQHLETLTNKTNWVTGPDTDIKSVDLGAIGEKFEFPLEHDIKMLVFGFQTPEVIFGAGNIAEGLAKEQGDAHEKVIRSLQEETEKVVEETIFKRLLEANGFSDVDVDIEWGAQGTSAKNEEITRICEALKIPNIQPALANQLEKRLAVLMDLDPDVLLEAEEERDHELPKLDPNKMLNAPPGAKPGFPPKKEHAPSSSTVSDAVHPLIDNIGGEGEPLQ